MQPNDPRKDLDMAGFDVYYNTATGRPRKYFADGQEAISWADDHADQSPEVFAQTSIYQPPNPVRDAKVATLDAFTDVLADWVNGAKENHDALDHRGEPVGEECWTRFYAGDITTMINDAARQVGVYGYQPKGS
jgi:hypothetical protein